MNSPFSATALTLTAQAAGLQAVTAAAPQAAGAEPCVPRATETEDIQMRLSLRDGARQSRIQTIP